jgi:beta-glucosidase
MHRVATVISDEARAKHHHYAQQGKRGYYQGLTFWSPNINIFRDPRWGRGQETYGEDPFLAGKMGVQFVKGLQGEDPRYLKVVATPKHYAVHSGPELLRHTFDAVVDDRDLRETYLPAFRECVIEGKAFSVMCAYNRFRGQPCCGSDVLLNSILRHEWGFQGYVVSDCGAIDDIFQGHKIVSRIEEATATGVKAGCDLSCGDPYLRLAEAQQQNLITEEEINVALKRLYTAKFKLGMFDPPERIPYSRIPYGVVDSPKHQELALEAAQKAIVLLKNENHLLPLSKNLPSLAVIGPNADDVGVLLGNYNGSPSKPVTPLEGIRAKVSSHTRVLYARGCPLAEGLPSFEVVPTSVLLNARNGQKVAGLKGEYFKGRFAGQPLMTRVDKEIRFDWGEGSPSPSIDDDNFSVRWTGEIVAPVSGTYALGGFGLTEYDIFLDGKLIVTGRHPHEPTIDYRQLTLEAGRAYKLRLEFYHKNYDAHFKLLWNVPGRDLLEQALQVARQADTILLVMGLSPRLEGEEMDVPVKGFQGGDRLTLDLPQVQQTLMEKIQALRKPVVLLLLNGSAVAVNWASHNIPAILEAWYPGQAGGSAIADVLFGDYNPAGRLPVTFYKSVDQLPPFEDYNMKGRTYRYFMGETLYPFAFGLSYTQFKYYDLHVPDRVEIGTGLKVSVDVQNAGRTPGDEVVQVYLTDSDSPVPVPIRSLKGFQRVHLNPGESRTVRFLLTDRDFSRINSNSKRIVEPGSFDIAVGGKQPGFKGSADAVTTEALISRTQLTGESKELEP